MQARETLVALALLATCIEAGQTPQQIIYYDPPSDGAPPEDVLQMIQQSQNQPFQARNAGHFFSFIRHDTGLRHTLGRSPQTSAGDLPDTQTSAGHLVAFPEERVGKGTSSGGPVDNETSAEEVSGTESSAVDLLFTTTPAGDLLQTQTSPGDLLGTQLYNDELLGALTSLDAILDSQTSASDLRDTQTSASDFPETQTSASDLQDTQTSASYLRDTQTSASDLSVIQTSTSDLPETQTILNDITQTQTFANELLDTQTSVDDILDAKTSARTMLDIQKTKNDLTDINSSSYDPAHFHTSGEVSPEASHLPFSHSDTQTPVDEMEDPASGPLLLTTEVFHPSTTTLGEFPDTTPPPPETTAFFRATTDWASETTKGKDEDTKLTGKKPKAKDVVDHMQNTLNFAFDKIKRKPEPSDVPLGRSVDSRTQADYPAEHRGGQNNIYQYHFQDPVEGSYKFGFGDDNQWRHEERRSDGVVVGRYGWHDANGKHHVTHYVSDTRGYRVVSPGDKVLLHAPNPWSTTTTAHSPTSRTRPPSTSQPPKAIAYSVLGNSLPPTTPTPTTPTPTDETPTTDAHSADAATPKDSFPGEPGSLSRPSLPASEFMGRPPITYPLPRPVSKRPDAWSYLSPTPSPKPVWVRPRPEQPNRPIPSPFRPVNQPRPPLFSSPKPLKPLLSYLSLPRPKPGLTSKPNDKPSSSSAEASDKKTPKPGSSEPVGGGSKFVHPFRIKKPLHRSRKPVRSRLPPRPHLQPGRPRPTRPPSDGPALDDGQKGASQSESTDFDGHSASGSSSQSVVDEVRRDGPTSGQKDPQKHALDYAFMDEDYNLLASPDRSGATANGAVEPSERDSQKAVHLGGQDATTRPTDDDDDDYVEEGSADHQDPLLVASTEPSTTDEGEALYTTTSMESLTTDTEWPYLFRQPSTIPQQELPALPPLSPQNFWTDLLQQIYNLPSLVPQRIRPTLQ